MALPLINSFQAEDYMNMITAVAKNNYTKLCKYDYELDDIISELYIEVHESLRKLAKKSTENQYNIDGWVMRSMINKIFRLLNKETYRVKKNLYVELVREEEMTEFNANMAEKAIEHARTILQGIENDVLDCLIQPPEILLNTENRTYTMEGLSNFLGITTKKLMTILDKIRTIIYNLIDNDNLCYE